MDINAQITTLTSSGIVFAVILLLSIADYIDKQKRPILPTTTLGEHVAVEISPRSQLLRKTRSSNNVMTV
jgi:hypothetical protein